MPFDGKYETTKICILHFFALVVKVLKILTFDIFDYKVYNVMEYYSSFAIMPFDGTNKKPTKAL